MARMTVAAWITATRDALEGHGRRPLIEFLQRQRWFGGKGRPLVDVRVLDAVPIPDGEPPRCVALLGVEYRGAERERYAMPLVVRPVKGSGDAQAIAPVPGSSAQEWVCDATTDEST